MMPDTVHLVFKTHLDIGFTDYAANVVSRYHGQFIPQAMALAARTRETDTRFRWTVGAWLIYDHLEQADAEQRRAMEQAIEAGDIVWHALPFTTHTELMDASLFRFGLSYAQRLDRRFGRRTIAGKMTDVPGHTRAMVPLLHEAGIRLLHLGVNPVSAIPDVPPVFLWRDVDSGTEVCVVYDPTYGGVTHVDGMRDVLAVVLTGDNEGPPPVEDVEAKYAELREAHPGAQVVASTMDAFAATLWDLRDMLPVVTSEIGDTWIHGVGSDPLKVAQFRALSMLRHDWEGSSQLTDAERAAVDAFSNRLMMIPEHTWGMDEKTHLPNTTHYTRDELAALRREPDTQAFERSWAEQRGYIDAAVEALAGTRLAATAKIANETMGKPGLWWTEEMAPPDTVTIATQACTLTVEQETGAAINWVDTATGQRFADRMHPLAALSYTVYGREDYERYWRQYIRNGDRPDYAVWAREDNMKLGIPTERAQTWTPSVTGIDEFGGGVVLQLTFPTEAQAFGAPEQVWMQYLLRGNVLQFWLLLYGKPANRIAEAFWLTFNPANVDPAAWRFQKMGRWIDPLDVVSRGARTLHAADHYVQCGNQFMLHTLDAPLVAPGRPSLLDFHNELPDMRGGVHVCLYNNVWGTNFPMWYEDHAQFRFAIRLAP